MMNRRSVGRGTLLFGTLVIWGPLAGVLLTAPSVLAKEAASISAADKSFMLEAAEGGSAEVALGELAKEKAQNEAVKQFGQHMVSDHTKADKELTDLAVRKGVAVSMELKPKHKKLMEALSKLSGAEFDKQYMREMVKDHESDVAAFQKEADKGKDGDLTTWVKQTLPTLQGHLAMAREAEAKVK